MHGLQIDDAQVKDPPTSDVADEAIDRTIVRRIDGGLDIKVDAVTFDALGYLEPIIRERVLRLNLCAAEAAE